MSISFASVPPATASDLPPGAALPTDGHAPLPFAAPFSPAHAYDWLSHHAPHAPAIRRQNAACDGSIDLTNAQWAATIRRAAAYVRAHTDAQAQSSGNVVAFCAHADVLDYLCLTHGTELAGLVDLQLATNNSSHALAHLIREAGAHFLLSGPHGKADLDARVRETVQILQKEGWELMLIPWPSLDTLNSGPELDDTVAPYEADRPMAILHSSGTTGKWPKLRVYTQRAVRQLQLWPYFSPGTRSGDVTFLGNLPPFHAMAQQVSRAAPTTGTVLAGYMWASQPRPFDERSWTKALLATQAGVAIAAPVVYEHALRDATLIRLLRRVPVLIYGGAPLAPQPRHALELHGIRPRSFFGATEVFCVSSLARTDSAEEEGIPKTTMAHAYVWPIPGDADKAAELLWYATPHFAPVVYNGEWAGSPTYSTGDRYRILSPALPPGEVVSTEQMKDVRFELLGRIDDQVTLSNGEKVNPAPILDTILSHPDVQHAIVFGKSRPHPGVLIQLRPTSFLLPHHRSSGKVTDEWTTLSFARARDALWPLIQQANVNGPSHAHISSDMVLFASADRPFLLTGKGSVRSVPTLELYTAEIDQAYNANASADISAPASWTGENTLAYLCKLLSACLAQDVTPAHGDEDLFQTLGADSVVATKVWQGLASVLPPRADQLSITLVYDHPTPKALAAAIHNIATGGQADPLSKPDPLAIMERLVEHYSAFPPATPTRQAPKHTFIVTGTTGSMGCHLLAQLLVRADVETVYALNRPGAPLQARQAQALGLQGLDQSLAHSPKLRLVGADWASEEALASTADDYETMVRAATHIIHAAWKLDFVIPVQSFESQIAGVHALATLAARSGAHIAFISSVASVLDLPDGTEPDEMHVPLSWAQGGYGRSKAVAEHVLARAADASIGTTILRTGQLTGATSTGSGAWNTSEWFPALVQVSQHLNALPLLTGTADWLPMDRAAGTVVDATLARAGGVLHLTNARCAELADVMHSLAHTLGLPLVSPTEWMGALAALHDNRYAATRLLSFLQGVIAHPLPLLPPHRTALVSPTLAETQAVGDRDVSRWVAFWRSQGFIQ